MHRALVITAALSWSFAAHAHDAWLEPQRHLVSPRTPVPMVLQIGHAGEQAPARITKAATWVRSFASRGPSGLTDLRPTRGVQKTEVSFSTPGTYLVSLHTSGFNHQMEPEAFVSYLREEGLTFAENRYKAAPISGRKIRESYTRFTKALIHVGSQPAREERWITSPVGHRLEIVPAQNIYALPNGGQLAVKILYEGRPLAGALVTLGSLNRPTDPSLPVRTNEEGQATFAKPAQGRWLVNTVWSVPASRGAKLDFETSFSSLTFEVPGSDKATSP